MPDGGGLCEPGQPGRQRGKYCLLYSPANRNFDPDPADKDSNAHAYANPHPNSHTYAYSHPHTHTNLHRYTRTEPHAVNDPQCYTLAHIHSGRGFNYTQTPFTG